METIELENLPISVFDQYTKLLRGYVEALRVDERQIKEFQVPTEPQALIDGLPISVGDNAFSGLIMRKNTFVELGNPDAGSSAFPLWSNDISLIEDGRITLIGTDIPGSEGESLPFGQVVLVAGANLSKTEHEALELKQYASNLIEGYMIRSAPGRVWSRISRDVVAKGFDFEMLGKALLALFKQQIPHVEAVEIIFVTSSKADVEKLEAIADRVRSVGDNLVKEAWVDKGFDPDACIEHDCSTCHEQTDCDDIREVVQLQQKAKRERKSEEKRVREEQNKALGDSGKSEKSVVRKFRR